MNSRFKSESGCLTCIKGFKMKNNIFFSEGFCFAESVFLINQCQVIISFHLCITSKFKLLILIIKISCLHKSKNDLWNTFIQHYSLPVVGRLFPLLMNRTTHTEILISFSKSTMEYREQTTILGLNIFILPFSIS